MNFTVRSAVDISFVNESRVSTLSEECQRVHHFVQRRVKIEMISLHIGVIGPGGKATAQPPPSKFE
jgi:hypothetical protein